MDMCLSGSFKDFLVRGTRSTVPNVVQDRPVEQGSVLWHDANVGSQGLQVKVANIGAVDRDGALTRLKEAKQEFENGGFTATAGSNDRHASSSWDFHGESIQDGVAVVPVAKDHVVQLYGRRAVKYKRHRVGVLNRLAVNLTKAKHGFHVGERLRGLAIDGAQKIERHGELKDEAVHHDQVSHGEQARCNIPSSHIHHGRESHGENGVLPGVQDRQRRRRLQGSLLVLFQRLVVLLGFKVFVAKILDRFKVDERVRRTVGTFIVGRVHFASNLDTPSGRAKSPSRIGDQGDERHSDILHPILMSKDATDQTDFKNSRHHVEDEHGQELVDCLGTSVDRSCERTGLTRQMESQVQM